ncbi:deoxyribose-phosphate aldolase [Paenimyroides ceti]
MTNLSKYIDATFLKTTANSDLSAKEVEKEVLSLIEESILEKYKLVMIPLEYVGRARKQISAAVSKVLVGTVIDFPDGDGGMEKKRLEAIKAIEDGADELDFVIDYKAFLRGETKKVKQEVVDLSDMVLEHGKTIKWIIETAALNAQHIVQLTALIKNCIVSNFEEDVYQRVYVKSSTGFYKTAEGVPNGATTASVVLMLENATPLQVKASGGIKNYEDAMKMIALGVKRIGTSSQKAILNQKTAEGDY